jgi:hypothetical protein
VTATAAAAPRSLAFGSLDNGLWGAAWLPGGDQPGLLAVGTGDVIDTLEVSLEGYDAGDHWRITGAQAELALAPSAEASDRPVDGRAGGFDQLCQLTGRLTLQDREHRVSCLGWRSAAGDQTAFGDLDSFRQVAAWFAPDDGLAVLALRPRSARGQDADLVSATVLDPQGGAPVTEPRLSTTYAGNGLPRRAGLELWIGEEGEEYPRRAAGEALAAAAAWSIGQFDLKALPFRWHSRGHDGAGIYVLGTSR